MTPVLASICVLVVSALAAMPLREAKIVQHDYSGLNVMWRTNDVTTSNSIRVSDNKRFEASTSNLYRPRNPNAVFNASFAWLCLYPNDVSKFRNLLAAGENEAALRMEWCLFIEKPIEGIQIDSIGQNLIQITVVKDGRTADMWTERELFKNRNSWLVDECQRTGSDYNTCSAIVYQ